jgi:hypothetical protein
MDELPDLEVIRGNGLVVIRWAGSPRFTIAVPDEAAQKVALIQAAESMEHDARRHSGLAQKEIEACIRGLRRLASTEPQTPPLHGAAAVLPRLVGSSPTLLELAASLQTRGVAKSNSGA